MIRTLLSSVKDPGPLKRCLVGFVITAALQGVGFVLLVPTLRALIEGDYALARTRALVMVAALAIYGVARHISQIAAYRAAIGTARTLFSQIGNHVAALPLGWFDKDRVGTIGHTSSQAVTDVMGVPAHLLRPIINAYVTPLVVLTVMAWWEWRLGLAALAVVPFAALTVRWAGQRALGAEQRLHDSGTDATNRVVEFAQTQAVLRSCGRAHDGFDKLDAALVEQRDANRGLVHAVIPGLIAFTVVVQAAFLVLLIVGATIALGGAIDAALLVALLVLAVRFVEPLMVAADVSAALKLAGRSVDRIDELLTSPPLPEPKQPATMVGNAIEFDNVSFSYNADDPERTAALKNVSFTAPSGSMVALVGSSGSGKTTVARLSASFWDSTAGTVKVGGIDVRDLASADLMKHLSIVFQDTYLFAGTIEDNVRLAKQDASHQELDEVAKLARLDEVIHRLPAGWDTPVGESGARLSGGERRRVSIARALLKGAPIVLLDEATASVDPANEMAIEQAIDTLRGRCTVMVIAHRLSTIVAADQIIVLDAGQVIESGTHQELLDAHGAYRNFWRTRNETAGWRLGDPSPRVGDASPKGHL